MLPSLSALVCHAQPALLIGPDCSLMSPQISASQDFGTIAYPHVLDDEL